MLNTPKSYMYWIGLCIPGSASGGLVFMLWLIFAYYPANYHRMHWDYPTHFPTYFWQYYIWQILAAFALILLGLYLMKVGVKKRRQA